jgi:WD40 repeat protein
VEFASTLAAGGIRGRDAGSGDLLRVLGPDTDSLLMGAAFHPELPLLAVLDFYGELLAYDTTDGRVRWRRDLAFGPGITVDFSPCGRWLAAGGYHGRARVVALDDGGTPTRVLELDAPNRGVVKSLCFAGSDLLLVASGDGSLVVHQRRGDRFVAVRTIRGEPAMELCNGVAVSPDGRTAYVVSRDQTVRAFDVESGAELATSLAHVRGVKTVHASECGRHLVTGSYDRTVILWNAGDLSVRMPPIRLANSGVSCVRWRRGRVYACSFDGMVWTVDGNTGEILWHRTSAHVAGGA